MLERGSIYDRAITAIKEALAQPEQEPVAWRWGVPKLKNGDFEWRYSLNQTRPDAIPLYTTPPQPEQEPVAITITGKLGNIYSFTGDYSLKKGDKVYTTPPQRKPLSNQKIIEMYNEPRSDAEMIEFARAIEAAHGIWPENSDCYGPDWTDRDGEYLK